MAPICRWSVSTASLPRDNVTGALAMEVLPSNFEFGKDMGLWHVSWGSFIVYLDHLFEALPQMVVPLGGGFIIDSLGEIGKKINYPELGYTVIFASAILWFLLSVATVKKIELITR